MLGQPSAAFRNRAQSLQVPMPLALGALVIVFQLGVARLIHDNLGDDVHFMVEILFFATVGPAAAYWALTRAGLWLGERQRLEAQGGRIWAEKRSTGGAAFSFSLPVWRDADA